MRVLIRYLGVLLLISSFFRVVPIVVGLSHNEPVTLFVVSGCISLLLGSFMVFFARKKNKNEAGISSKNGLILAALSFLILPLIGAISFLPSFGYSVFDAVFESISGFTTTGLTLYSSLDNLPESLLIWRAMTQWIGGIGIVIFFLLILTHFYSTKNAGINKVDYSIHSKVSLMHSQGFEESFESGLKKTISKVILIYCFYTALGIAGLMLAGLPFLESMGLSFTAISTGGFTMNDSFFVNNAQLIILSILMILGAISFVSHNKIFQLKIKKFLSAYEKNVFLFVLLVAIGIGFLMIHDIKISAFEMISAFTTTGYSLSAIHLMPHLFIMIVMMGMIIGGSTGSTAGGIKVSRIYHIVRSIPWYIRKRSISKSAVIPLKIHGKIVDEDHLVGITIFVFTYLFFLFIGTVIFMLFGYSFLDSSFQIVSALGTVGLQTMDLATVNPLLKIILMLAMLLGRLEIFPVLMVFRTLFKRK